MLLGDVGYRIYQNQFDYDTRYSQKEYSQIKEENINLVFYKRGCPYCRAGKQSVIKASQASQIPTFFIDVESKEGKLLVAEYGVTKAATLVKIRDGVASNMIYAVDKDDKIIPDKKVISEVFND